MVGIWLAAALPAQLRGPDVELSVGVVAPFQRNPGSGPTAAATINHGYRIGKVLYTRLGLGMHYRHFVVTDNENIGPAPGPQVFRRHFDLVQLNGLATLVLGFQVGEWSLELGTAYVPMLWSDARLTTASYHANGVPVNPPLTRDVNFRTMPPPRFDGDYYYLDNANWWGTAAVNTRLSPRLALGVTYRRNLGETVLVHTNAFECSVVQECLRIFQFRRLIPAVTGTATLSLRYRLTSQ
ncbi:hypothetical protein CLV84_3032 [Neolewinella xylanilytica]|uniref:Outer membrane protein with beta-barrel domain n=2 Tax=Neolewinella xylanilytica TaxID=1514080 RepID=A0A2S6I4K0_9BACT|nr:hypothetical protein CLV84_3032 [Neolewinella xylanilytica]